MSNSEELEKKKVLLALHPSSNSLVAPQGSGTRQSPLCTSKDCKYEGRTQSLLTSGDLFTRWEPDGSHGLGSRVNTCVFSRLGSLPTPSPFLSTICTFKGTVKVADHGRGRPAVGCWVLPVASPYHVGFTKKCCAQGEGVGGWGDGGEQGCVPGTQSLRLGRTYCSFLSLTRFPQLRA